MVSIYYDTPSKKYYESSMLNAKKGPMKTAAQNRSANSDGSVIARGPTFSLVNALHSSLKY